MNCLIEIALKFQWPALWQSCIILLQFFHVLYVYPYAACKPKIIHTALIQIKIPKVPGFTVCAFFIIVRQLMYAFGTEFVRVLIISHILIFKFFKQILQGLRVVQASATERWP